MPPFEKLHNLDVIFLLGVAVLTALTIVLARLSHSAVFPLPKDMEREGKVRVHEFPGKVSEGFQPVPWYFWVLTVAYVLWGTLYVVWISRRGI